MMDLPGWIFLLSLFGGIAFVCWWVWREHRRDDPPRFGSNKGYPIEENEK